ECCAPWGAIPHADLLRRLPTRGLGDRLPALDVARGGRRPVPVAVAGAAPQAQQHVPIPPAQHVSGRNHAEPHRPTLEGPTLLFPDPLILSPMKLSTQLQYGDDPVG